MYVPARGIYVPARGMYVPARYFFRFSYLCLHKGIEKPAMQSPIEIDTSNAEFQNALKLIQYTRQSVFLTGKAGTGKSTFLKYICQHTKKKYVVLAPTGIAAINAGGSTLHSFFKLRAEAPCIAFSNFLSILSCPMTRISAWKEGNCIVSWNTPPTAASW